eukprot:COSAG02_NODE_1700_length_11253_cov_40.995786_3_plen_52_part_00
MEDLEAVCGGDRVKAAAVLWGFICGDGSINTQGQLRGVSLAGETSSTLPFD